MALFRSRDRIVDFSGVLIFSGVSVGDCTGVVSIDVAGVGDVILIVGVDFGGFTGFIGFAFFVISVMVVVPESGITNKAKPLKTKNQTDNPQQHRCHKK